MNKYNLDKLVKVEYNDFSETRWYKYRKKKSILGFVTRKEGIYSSRIWKEDLKLEVPKNHILKDGIVYENPSVTLYYQGGHAKTYYFESLYEAEKFANKFTVSGNWQD